MALEAGSIISRLLLDMSDFKRALKTAPGIAKKDLQKVNRAMSTTMRQMDKSVKGFVDKSVVHGKKFEKTWWSRFGAVAIGFTIAYRAMRLVQTILTELARTFTKGIQAIDDYRTAVIRTAAALSMLSEQPTTEGLQAYLAYARDTFQDLEMIAARHFATADDLREAYAKFTTMGIVPIGPEQLESMASLVDWILIAEEALGRTLQIRSEIESTVEGTMRKGAVMARMANQMIADYKEQLRIIEATASSTEKSKIFFEMMSPILSAITRYSDEILKTHMAWRANLDAIFKKIWRAGLNKAYEDLLDIMRDISGALIQHGRLTETAYKVAYAYHIAWETLKAVVLTVSDVAVGLYRLWDDMTLHLSPVLHTFKLIAMGVMTIKAGLDSWVVIIRNLKPLLGDLFKGLVERPWETLKAIGTVAWGPVLQKQIEMTKKAAEDAYITLLRFQKGIRTLGERLLVPNLEKAIRAQAEFLDGLQKRIYKMIDSQEEAKRLWEEMFAKVPVGKMSKELQDITDNLTDSMQAIGDWSPGAGFEDWRKNLEAGDEALEELRKTYEKLLAALKAGGELTDKMVKDQIRAYQIIYNMYKELVIEGWNYVEEYKAAQEDLLQAQKRRVEKELGNVVDANEAKLLSDLWYAVEKRKLDKATNDKIWKSSQHFLERVQDATADAFYDILTIQEDIWENFFDTIKDLFIRTLAEMAAEALKREIVMRVTTSVVGGAIGGAAGGAINPMTGAALGGGGTAAGLGAAGIAGVGGVVAAYIILKKMHRDTVERNRREFERLKALAAAWKLVSTEITDLLYANTELDKALRSINEQFDSYRKTLVDLGATSEKLTWLEEKRTEALEKERQRLLKEFAAPLEAIIAGFTMGGVADELRKLDIWYDDQIENARALGQESVNLLREALELSKKQLAIKQMETLIAAQAAAQEIILTIGMTPMELQIHMVEQARDELGDAIGDIQGSIEALVGSIADTEAEINSLQTAYDEALRLSGEAENRWLDAQQAVIDILSETMVTTRPAFGPAVVEPIKEAYERDVFGREVTWDEFLDYLEGQGYFEGWRGGVPLYAGLAQEYFDAQLGWAEAQAHYLPLIQTIPGEIETLDAALVDFRGSVDELAAELTAAGHTAEAAYVAQMAALTETFLGGLQDIIRSHTMSELELGLYELNQWYEEQVIAAEALGLSLDLVNQAYDLQRQALLDAANASNDLTDSLEGWLSVLESLEKQIFNIQTSLQNPLDVLERMSIAEQDIIAVLGSGWQQGIFDLSELTPESISDLQDVLGTYLDLAGEAFQRPSVEYGDIYASVLNALEAMTDVAEEQITDLEIQIQQLDAQNAMVSLLEGLSAVEGSLQTGGYVPHTGLYRLHEGEEVISSGGAGRGTQFEMYLTINESETPHETGRVVTDAVKTFLRSSQGRTLVQETSKGR